MRTPAIPLTVLTIAAMGCTDELSTAPLAGGSVAALAVASDVPLPFRGTLSTTHTSVYDPESNTQIVHLIGEGTATHVGKYRWVSDVVFANLPALAGTETTTLVAANGDMIFATGTVAGTPSEDGQSISSVEALTITGGTGRFGGATGSFVLRQMNLAPDRTSSGSFDVTISFNR